jgi:uncharacterized membrane protein
LELQQGVDGDKWFTNGATFTVTAQDNTSGIEKVGYTIKKADGTYVEGSADAPVELITGVESDAKEYTDSISIPDMADYDTDNLTITIHMTLPEIRQSVVRQLSLIQQTLLLI